MKLDKLSYNLVFRMGIEIVCFGTISSNHRENYRLVYFPYFDIRL